MEPEVEQYLDTSPEIRDRSLTAEEQHWSFSLCSCCSLCDIIVITIIIINTFLYSLFERRENKA